MKIVQRSIKWSTVVLVLLAIIGASAWKGWTWWLWASSPPAASQSPNRLQVEIPQGTSAREIGQDLKSAGLIRSTTAWELWSRWLSMRDPDGGYQAGIYKLSPEQPLQAIATTLWNGHVLEHSFTIPEGYSLRQMAAYFEEQEFFTAEEFLTAARQIPRDHYPWLPDNLPHLEGFLFPDTYQLTTEKASPQEIIDRMLERFQQVALPVYMENRNRTDLSFQEWVTLASIVEKEAVVPSERNRIAGVFVRRLDKGMPLGADPTVEYGLGIRQTADQPLTLNQVRTPTDYNTYLNPGLPPTPIASPGLASLKATLNPENTPYLYFVARYDGTHIFSRTLAEHEAAQRAIWKERDRQASEKNKPKPKTSPKPAKSSQKSTPG